MTDGPKRVSEAQLRAAERYCEKFDDLRVRVPRGQRQEIAAHAAQYDNGSVNAFINRAISETMDRDKNK